MGYSKGFAENSPTEAATTRLQLLNTIQKSNLETVRDKNVLKHKHTLRQKSREQAFTTNVEELDEDAYEEECINLNPIISFAS